MNETLISQLTRRRISLFDSDGLPWTAHLSMAWLIWIFVLTGGLASVPIGICIGIWIRVKTRSMLALLIYVLLAGACAATFLPGSVMTPRWTDAVGFGVVILWFAGALIGRHQIARYYAEREGSDFRLSLAFTLLFGVWYLNYRIRPEFRADVRIRPMV